MYLHEAVKASVETGNKFFNKDFAAVHFEAVNECRPIKIISVGTDKSDPCWIPTAGDFMNTNWVMCEECHTRENNRICGNKCGYGCQG